MAVKSVSIRIEEAMLKKIGYVADYEGRSINSHILCLIRDDIKAFGEFLQQNAPQTDIAQADTDHIRQWLMQQREQKKSATTVNRRLAALRAFYLEG